MSEANILTVTREEAGQKLLRFLERRLNAHRPELYRWLRTGQIRLNKSRAKAESIINAFDEVRLPPQALELIIVQSSPTTASYTGTHKITNREQKGIPDYPYSQKTKKIPENASSSLPVLLEDDNILIINKPAGLPVQLGSGHTDSIASRLKEKAALSGLAFAPAPAHRLDKQSSGVLVAGKTHLYLRYLHSLFSGKSSEMSGGISVDISGAKEAESCSNRKALLERDYLFWVSGLWNLESETLLQDTMVQVHDKQGMERMACLATAQGGNSYTIDKLPDVPCAAKATKGLAASARFQVLKQLQRSPCGSATLLKARLLSGRKHQLRVQCASRGYPIIGDTRYGGARFCTMLLHATHIFIPAVDNFYGQSYPAYKVQVLPDWTNPFTV